jgi:hypothetical protein
MGAKIPKEIKNLQYPYKTEQLATIKNFIFSKDVSPVQLAQVCLRYFQENDTGDEDIEDAINLIKDHNRNPKFGEKVSEQFSIYDNWIELDEYIINEFYALLFIVARIKSFQENDIIKYVLKFYDEYCLVNHKIKKLLPDQFEDFIVNYKEENLSEILSNLFLSIKIQPINFKKQEIKTQFTKVKSAEKIVIPRETRKFYEKATTKVETSTHQSKVEVDANTQKNIDWINSQRERIGI